MKLLKSFILLAAIVSLAGCNNDEEVAPKEEELNNVTFSFLNKENIMEIPEALANAGDPYAAVAVSYLNSANTLSSYLSYFTFPQNAQVTHNRIEPANGRSQAGEYRVYTWTDAQLGSVAYQLGDHGDYYTFEVMVKEPGMADWLLILSGEEEKDRAAGFMRIYNTYSDDPSEMLANYEWSTQGDISNFVYTFQQDESYSISVEISMNQKTGAGNIHFFEDGSLSLQMDWDELGNGTWTSYNSEGSIVEEGSWTS